MTILILGADDDDHADHVYQYFMTHGRDVEFLDSRLFPSVTGISYDPATGRGAIRLPDGRRLATDEIEAVYWRCYHGIETPELPDPEQAYIARNDARSLFESLLIHLPTRWVNGWRAFQLHQTKPVQLAMVAALGVPVPATLLGNDADSIRQFVVQHPRSIFKPVQGGAHARPVTPDHLTDENLRNLAIAPVTIQEEVPGTNIRVFVAGRRILACEIMTDRLDYRDDLDAAIQPVELPPEVRSQCVEIAQRLTLRWTGIDFRRTPQGQYVFLEANPSPMFLGFEQRTGLPLTESLVAVLIGED